MKLSKLDLEIISCICHLQRWFDDNCISQIPTVFCTLSEYTMSLHIGDICVFNSEDRPTDEETGDWLPITMELLLNEYKKELNRLIEPFCAEIK